MEIPAKKSLVLLPGLLCDGSVWQHQVRVLADLAAARSIEWTLEDSLPAMAQTVLRNAPERFSLAGHSMGGRVALEVYRAAPERVERIALLNTGYQPLAPGKAGEDEARGRYALLELACSQGMRAMARQWLPPMIHPDRQTDTPLVEAILEMFTRKTPEMFAAQIKALLNRPDAGGVLEQIDCPALVLTGREDGWSPPSRHTEIAAKIRGSKLVIVPDCGHMSPMERPEAVGDALREWLLAPTR
jgi:pimeloyl-ACP methyl ester carboxylesterase